MERTELTFNLNVKISPSSELVTILNKLIAMVSNEQPVSTTVEKPTVVVKEEPKKPVEAVKEPEAVVAKQETPEESEKLSETPSVTLEDLRTILTDKVTDNRATIKQKLTDLGATNLTKLEPSKYQEMYDFLKTL